MASVMSQGVDEDEEVRAALQWFANVAGSPQDFFERLANAQQAYRELTALPENLGQDPIFNTISSDVVAAYLAQAKSMLDDRRSYDIALASQVVPWVKQIGRNLKSLAYIPGAVERTARMLSAKTVTPDSAFLELVMAVNYATDGFNVAFIEEAPGKARTPDFQLEVSSLSKPIFVECKRLKRGQYEIREKARHKELFLKTEELIFEQKLSVHLDVTYTRELGDVPDGYLFEHLKRASSSSIITPAGYPWRDEFGFGRLKRANVDAAHQDIIRNGSVLFGTKLARLLCGSAVREGGYGLVAQANPDERDPRFINSLDFGSVVTWQCIAPPAILKKARIINAKLAEADQQLSMHGTGIVHLAMDMELQCESSDLRRARNNEAVAAFQPSSKLLAVYLHYLVPRIPESHAWIVDETVDRFGRGDNPVPHLAIFPGSTPTSNEHPAWKQKL